MDITNLDNLYKVACKICERMSIEPNHMIQCRSAEIWKDNFGDSGYRVYFEKAIYSVRLHNDIYSALTADGFPGVEISISW